MAVVAGIAADQAMLTEEPEIAKPGDGRSRDVVGEKIIRISVSLWPAPLDELIDLGRGKARDGEVEARGRG